MSKNKFIHGSEFSCDHLRQAIELDQLYYDKSDLVPYETCSGWKLRNPDIYSGVISNRSGELLGYINLMPVEKSTLNMLLVPGYHESNLPSDKIAIYLPQHQYHTYLASVVKIKSKETAELNSSGLTLMQKLFFDKLSNLNSKSFRVSSVWARTITLDGTKYAKNIGMKLIKDSVWMMSIT